MIAEVVWIPDALLRPRLVINLAKRRTRFTWLDQRRVVLDYLAKRYGITVAKRTKS